MSSQVESRSPGHSKEHNEVPPAPGRGPKETEASRSWSNFASTPSARLAMDAVQKANSGHPGTPMALAPLAFVLWDRHLQHNPRNPHWPGRDRFILSNGHASMLLYSMLHLTGLRSFARRHQAVSPVGIEDAGPSRVRTDGRHRDHDRAAGPGCRQLSGHGDCASAGWPRRFDKDGLTFRLPHLRLLRRRRLDGRREQRSRFGRGTSWAVKPDLVLRQQPHHHRGQHVAGVHR